jgi:hypothetical protein
MINQRAVQNQRVAGSSPTDEKTPPARPVPHVMMIASGLMRLTSSASTPYTILPVLYSAIAHR